MTIGPFETFCPGTISSNADSRRPLVKAEYMDAVLDKQVPVKRTFSPYQKFIVGMLAFLQFTIILDFMIISPLGAIVIPALHISPRQFG